MSEYDFSTQKDLFDIANQILTDYNIQEWSFGGGTALSYLYYQHRISYDIDIFSEDYSAINRLALQDLMPNMAVTKDDLSPIINNIMSPGDTITVAVDSTEVVAFDEFIEMYRSVYEEVGKFDIYTIENTGITYKDVLNLKRKEVLKLTKT